LTGNCLKPAGSDDRLGGRNYREFEQIPFRFE
jgi:hypothetical protein